MLKAEECYKDIPAKVSQQVLRKLETNWKAFRSAIQADRSNPSKFLGRPKLPKYKDKDTGRNLLVSIQAISNPGLRLGWIKLSKTQIKVPVLHRKTGEVRIVPKLDHYVIEVVYEQE
ncbi:MAG: hypothetical protein WBL95_08110 [Microcoleus sp.]